MLATAALAAVVPTAPPPKPLRALPAAAAEAAHGVGTVAADGTTTADATANGNATADGIAADADAADATATNATNATAAVATDAATDDAADPNAAAAEIAEADAPRGVTRGVTGGVTDGVTGGVTRGVTGGVTCEATARRHREVLLARTRLRKAHPTFPSDAVGQAACVDATLAAMEWPAVTCEREAHNRVDMSAAEGAGFEALAQRADGTGGVGSERCVEPLESEGGEPARRSHCLPAHARSPVEVTLLHIDPLAAHAAIEGMDDAVGNVAREAQCQWPGDVLQLSGVVTQVFSSLYWLVDQPAVDWQHLVM